MLHHTHAGKKQKCHTTRPFIFVVNTRQEGLVGQVIIVTMQYCNSITHRDLDEVANV